MLNVSLSIIRGLRTNFPHHEFFILSQLLDIVILCETNLEDSTDTNHHSIHGYYSLIQKCSSTHMLGVERFVKDNLPFTGDVSLESCKDSYMYCHLSLLYSISYSLYLCWFLTSLSCAICVLFHLILTWVSVSSDSYYFCRTTAVAEIPFRFTLLDVLFFRSYVCNATSQK